MEVAFCNQVFTPYTGAREMAETKSNGREGSVKDWRELCAAAAVEPDSEKLVALVDQILRAFDEHDQAVTLPNRSKRYCSQL
jgi:hypothetical protein